MTMNPDKNQIIGILGGGQLGRMLAIAAAEMGLRCHIYAPPGDNPAFDVAAFHTEASYDDRTALQKFAESVSVVTYEFENIPVEQVRFISEIVPVHPGVEPLKVSQDRLIEKQFIQSLDIPVAPFARLDSLADIRQACTLLGQTAVIKTRRLGYDGKGQMRLDENSDLGPGGEAAQFFNQTSTELIFEQFISFDREISVILARSQTGETKAFPCAENEHVEGILRRSVVPATVCPLTSTSAVKHAIKIAEALQYVGVLAVEFFVCEPDDSGIDLLYVNEIAPRVHNSGHWTQDGCDTSQFEQHIRAVVGWPLGPTRRHSDIEMYNILGQDEAEVAKYARQSETKIHLYGKAAWKRGRKMGHANKVLPLD
jgi:5-(carboxyamino)imidazole ribonucleotide synthase